MTPKEKIELIERLDEIGNAPQWVIEAIKCFNMTAKDKADRLVQIFGLEEAKQYVILWQDEYITEQDRIFRQEVKQEINKL